MVPLPAPGLANFVILDAVVHALLAVLQVVVVSGMGADPPLTITTPTGTHYLQELAHVKTVMGGLKAKKIARPHLLRRGGHTDRSIEYIPGVITAVPAA